MNPFNRPWQDAVDSYRQGFELLKVVQRIMSTAEGAKLMELESKHFAYDVQLLRDARIYAWGPDTLAATMAASATVPLETKLDRWNLDTLNVWWHLADKPSWLTTTTEGRVRALSMGWLGNHFWVSAWIEDGGVSAGSKLTPSQIWNWHAGESLGDMLVRIRLEHDRLYGPGGPWHDKPQVGVEMFMAAAEGLSRFVLAGLAWVEQRVLVAEPQHIERHVRKDLARRTGSTSRTVHVVSLRRTAHSGTAEGEATSSDVAAYSVRFLVSGHWRLQPCGPQHSERRLTYVHPYVKGPEDKPFRAATKIYNVER